MDLIFLVLNYLKRKIDKKKMGAKNQSSKTYVEKKSPQS